MTSKRWGVFLDRDGTLVPNAHHPVRPDQLRLYPAAGESLRRLSQARAKLVVVSNQSVVARGLLDARGLRRMDRRLRSLLRDQEVSPARVYYCPHHPEFTGACECRKPSPGMVLRGLEALHLEATRCFLIGDTVSDMAAGRAAGLRTVLVLTGHGRRERREVLGRSLADHVAARLEGAVHWILANRARL